MERKRLVKIGLVLAAFTLISGGMLSGVSPETRCGGRGSLTPAPALGTGAVQCAGPLPSVSSASGWSDQTLGRGGGSYQQSSLGSIGLETERSSGLGDRGVRIAVIKPVFTATAYSSFYTFYLTHASAEPGETIITDVRLLTAKLVDSWGFSDGLRLYLYSHQAADDGILLGRNTAILTDAQVDQGRLFYANSTKAFDVVILGHEEYVTRNEYYSLRDFAYSGGRLVVLDANSFLAEVAYSPSSKTVSLVKGHGWAFDGAEARPSVFDAWRNESAGWVGSVYGRSYSKGYKFDGATPNAGNPIGLALQNSFGDRVFGSYRPHEENFITNPKVSIIATWNLIHSGDHSHLVVAAYQLSAGPGIVIATGVFGSDIIFFDRQMQFFLKQAVFSNLSTHQSTGWDRLAAGPLPGQGGGMIVAR